VNGGIIQQGYAENTSGNFTGIPGGDYSVSIFNDAGQQTEVDRYNASGQLVSQYFVDPEKRVSIGQNVFSYEDSGQLNSWASVNLANQNYAFTETLSLGVTNDSISVCSGSNLTYNATLLGGLASSSDNATGKILRHAKHSCA
jgi:hypothetical protein